MSANLTKAQTDLLDDILHNGPQMVHYLCRPADVLIAKGLAKAVDYLRGDYFELAITDAGRAHPATTQGEAS